MICARMIGESLIIKPTDDGDDRDRFNVGGDACGMAGLRLRITVIHYHPIGFKR